MSAADTLRQAAELVEQRAAAATPGPWERSSRGGGIPNGPGIRAPLPDGEQGRYRDGRAEQVSVVRAPTWEGYGGFVRDRSGRDLNWVAMMGPQVAGPLAAWLRAEAELVDRNLAAWDRSWTEATGWTVEEHHKHPLALARALLGVASPVPAGKGGQDEKTPVADQGATS